MSHLKSQELEVTVWRDGKEYQQKYSRGNPVTTLMCYELSAESKDQKGTRIRFWPDKEGFPRLLKTRIIFMVAILCFITQFSMFVYIMG